MIKRKGSMFTYLIYHVLVPVSCQAPSQLPLVTLAHRWRHHLLGLSVWRPSSSVCLRWLEYHGPRLLWWCVWRLPWLQWEQGQFLSHQSQGLRLWYLMPENIQIYWIDFPTMRDEQGHDNPYKMTCTMSSEHSGRFTYVGLPTSQ